MSETKEKLMLIDGDIILYTTAYACEGVSNWNEVKEYIHNWIQETASEVGTNDYIGFLQGRNNFRTAVASKDDYKANRKDKPKPFWYYNIREFLIRAYDFKVIDGMETDDALTILHKRLKDHNTIICSIDKDLLQSPGKHYNLKTKEFIVSTEELALKTLATQIITGDATDNIKGLYRVGPVKAEKILAEASELGDYLPISLQAYLNHYFEERKKKNSDELDEEVFLKAVKHFAETFELVFLLRNASEEDFPTPEIMNLLTINDPLKYGERNKSEEDGKTIFD